MARIERRSALRNAEIKAELAAAGSPG
jgi:hypothetical protein